MAAVGIGHDLLAAAIVRHGVDHFITSHDGGCRACRTQRAAGAAPVPHCQGV
jgi:hypothetical protein